MQQFTLFPQVSHLQVPFLVINSAKLVAAICQVMRQTAHHQVHDVLIPGWFAGPLALFDVGKSCSVQQ